VLTEFRKSEYGVISAVPLWILFLLICCVVSITLFSTGEPAIALVVIVLPFAIWIATEIAGSARYKRNPPQSLESIRAERDEKIEALLPTLPNDIYDGREKDVFDIVVDTFAEVCELDKTKIKGRMTFADLGADSLDLVRVIFALEDKLSVEVPESDLEGVKTVAQLTDLVFHFCLSDK
jgi:acyl carrier protein